MHDIVVDELERHLSGSASRAFYSHLDGCAECRAEVDGMEDVSLLLREFRAEPESAPEPSFFFYNRVAGRIIEHERREAWGLFSPGVVFFRRVAFTSVLLLAGLAGYLITSQSPSAEGTDAATIMGQHDPSVDHENGSDRDHMLVTLATYTE
jgi:predicted anti-sigma-YlaC factor YlaD